MEYKLIYKGKHVGYEQQIYGNDGFMIFHKRVGGQSFIPISELWIKHNKRIKTGLWENELIIKICKLLNVNYTWLMTKDQVRTLADARKIIVFILSETIKDEYVLASLINRDRTTIRSYLKTDLKFRPDLKNKIEFIKKNIE